jgi:hypothetical protein
VVEEPIKLEEGLKKQILPSYVTRNPGKTIKYFTTFTNTIYDVLSSRGWEEAEADEDVSE